MVLTKRRRDAEKNKKKDLLRDVNRPCLHYRTTLLGASASLCELGI
jgi:hypothetical protein